MATKGTARDRTRSMDQRRQDRKRQEQRREVQEQKNRMISEWTEREMPAEEKEFKTILAVAPDDPAAPERAPAEEISAAPAEELPELRIRQE